MKQQVLLMVVLFLLLALAACNQNQIHFPQNELEEITSFNSDNIDYTQKDIPSTDSSNIDCTRKEIPSIGSNNMDYSLLDTDNNGLAEWLVLYLDISADSLSLAGSLEADIYGADGNMITYSRANTQALAMDNKSISLKEGECKQFTRYFNGKHIKESGIDGPYKIHVYVMDGHNDIILEDWLITNYLSANDFQGNLLAVRSFSDCLIEQGQTIRFTAIIEAQIAGNYQISASLFKTYGEEQTCLEHKRLTPNLSAGINQVLFDFDTMGLRGNGISGPYDLYLSIEDQFYSSYDHYQSASYQLSELANPGAYISGDLFRDSETTGSNKIGFKAPVMVTVAGNYKMQAVLFDKEGNLINADLWQEYLSEGSQFIEFNLDLKKYSTCTLEFRICDEDGQYGFHATLDIIP